MARIEVDPNYSGPTFSRATAATDLFKKEDVQGLAAAFSGHTHDNAGKGLPVATILASAIPNGMITSAMIQDATIVGADITGALSLTGSLVVPGATTVGGTLTSNGLILAGLGLQMPQNTSVRWGDTSSQIFSGSRTTYFDEYNGGWAFRNSVAYTTCLSLDGAGNLTVSTGLLVGGPGTRTAQAHVRGSSGATGWSGANNTSTTTMASTNGVLFIEDTTGAGLCGGMLLLGCGQKWFAGIRANFLDGTNYGSGQMGFATRNNVNDPTLTERMTIDSGTGTVNIASSRLSIGGDCVFVRGGANVVSAPGMGTPAGTFLGVNGFAYGSGGYCIGTPNAGGAGGGDNIAHAWTAYACVDHAIQFGLSAVPIATPVETLKTLTPYYYEHMSIEIGADEPTRDEDGTIESSPTYGMSAKQVATLLPELVGPPEGEPMTIDYSRLVVVLWAACQEMEARLTALEGAA